MKVMQSGWVIGTLVLVVTACSPAPESGRGFRLPDGDPLVGQQVFLDFQCHGCHTIPDVDLPSIDIAIPAAVSLGGPVSRVKTYGQLVTAIINPSHKLIKGYPEDDISIDGESRMPDMNDFLTVRQLIELVAYLQDQYQVVVPDSDPYSVYMYR